MMDARIAVVAAEYNERYVDGMLQSVHDVLAEAGCPAPKVYRVPGSYEIPVVVGHLIENALEMGDQTGIEAVICLGVIWQGQTGHADLIASAVTTALMELQVGSGIPCIHQILLVKDPEQARERCLEPETNRGAEAAHAALKMIRLVRGIRKTH